MLIRQPLTINDRDFILTFAISLKSEYSDWTVEDALNKLKDGDNIEYAIENHYYIVNQDNQKYSEAYDPIEFKDERIYTETDEKIDIEPVDTDAVQKSEAWDELTGGSANE